MREVDPDVVGLSIMTFQRGTAQKIVALVRALKPDVTDRRRRLRSRAWPRTSTKIRRGASMSSCAARAIVTFRELLRALEAGRDLSACRGPLLPAGPGVHPHPDRPVSSLTGRGGGAAQPQRPRADRLHLHRPAHRRRRDVARLHLRLQLLLDHRDARAELPHLVGRSGAGRHRRRAGARARAPSSSSTTTSR